MAKSFKKRHEELILSSSQPLSTLMWFGVWLLDAAKLLLWFVLSLVLLLIICGCVIFGISYKKALPLYEEYRDSGKAIVAESSESTFRSNETTMIFDVSGNLLTELDKDRDTSYLHYKGRGTPALLRC